MLINQAIKNLANNGTLNKHINKVLTDDSYAAKLLIVSNISKDVIGNGYDIYKTLNNDKIPKEKRLFNAATDTFINVFSWTSQVLSGFTISSPKFQEYMSRKLFGHLEKSAPALFSECKKGLTIASSLIVSTVIAKRIIIPFISIPLVSLIKRKYFDDK